MTTAERAASHLISNPSFAALTLAEASDFLGGGKTRSFGIGEVLLKEGAPGDTLLVITAGLVSVRTGEVQLSVEGAGATLGEMSLIDPAPRSATVVGVKSGTLIEIFRESFDLRLSKGDPVAIKALQGVTDTVLGRLASVNDKVRVELETPRRNVFSRLWKGLRGSGAGPLRKQR
jgi:CRP/FNR family cyclic AMP-dependent transcriptional regulator